MNQVDASEIWKDVEGYEGYYQVSDRGRVRSVDRIVAHPLTGHRRMKAKVLKLIKKSIGYYAVNFNREGKLEQVLVHRLVLSAFVGPSPGGHVCNHIDGDKTNNCPKNLEWVTHNENTRHAHAIGLINTRGEANPQSKLTQDQVQKIRKLYASGEYLQREIGEMFGVTKHTVSAIVRGKNWAHV